MPLGQMCANLVRYAEEALEKSDVTISKLITEPGRAVVGEAGYTLYTIGDMKKSGDKDLYIRGWGNERQHKAGALQCRVHMRSCGKAHGKAGGLILYSGKEL